MCAAQAGKILPVVADKLGVELPPVRFAKPQAGELPEYDKDVKLRCTLAQLGEVSVELVSRSDSKQWRSMMYTHHPRGAPAVLGKVVKYWLISERFGRVGGISFHAASWHDAARDKHIGWSQRARVANLEKVLNNSRFLILPQVRVHGLASKALGLAAARVANDWPALHGEVAVFEEPSSVKNNARLNWLLLCSEGTADVASARRICQWYEKRWSIEEYFRVLKSGAQVQTS